MIEMELVGVRVELPGPAPIILLRENNERGLVLPIFIGNAEANAIDLYLRNDTPPRPMTHDLFATALKEMNASLTKVVVTEIADKTFYAEIHVETTEGTKTINSRPSDAIALAVRMSSPIYAEEEVLASAGHEIHEENNDSEEDVLSEFRDFLDDVSPEDFSS
ncbi:MAG: hypothetical protein CL431_09025 [Acidimicrobiaceae bacterium]|jgi:bifunctional DNase/RNase|nr:hypothetical protein [Acidimicrobiaceae bacterium]|tara:strand:- start:32605 stop:33093 length:489 start_codon:yes stop_codon:yes gene_type:complete